MTLDNLTALIETLEDASLSFESVANSLRFLQSTDGQTISVQDVADITDRAENVIEPVLYRLDRAEVLHSVRVSSETYSLDEKRLVQIGHVIDWLTEFYEHQTLKAMADLRVNNLTPLYTVPTEADVNQRSNMTGQLLDMASNADERITVVVPFFSDAGVDTISESLAAATGRSVRVELLTRDLTMGNDQNQSHIESICVKVQAEGSPSKLSIFEFNRDRYPENTLHAKMLVVDSSRAYIGSANMTESSLRNSLEAGIYFDGAAATEIANDLDRFRDSELFVEVTSEFKS